MWGLGLRAETSFSRHPSRWVSSVRQVWVHVEELAPVRQLGAVTARPRSHQRNLIRRVMLEASHNPLPLGLQRNFVVGHLISSVSIRLLARLITPKPWTRLGV
jgi:hypothetical protein